MQVAHICFCVLELVLFVNDVTCGLEKIVGGRKVSNEEFPYQLSLRYKGRPICGAVLISDRVALSAAHCISKPGVYSIRAGTDYVEDGGVVSNVRHAILHPGYTKATEDFDLAILKLSEPLLLSKKIKPVRLPNQDESPPTGMNGHVSGWGSVAASFNYMTDRLRAVQLPVLDRDTCVYLYREITDLTPRMFCAGFREGGRDSCQGDSGGPFVVNGTLYGVVSWGFNCGEPGYPGIYTNISALRTYIKMNCDV